jgi:hypothetical protein
MYDRGKGANDMTDKTFKPVVLVQHRATGLMNLWTQRYWNSRGERKHEAFHVVAEANTFEEKAKLWKSRDNTNRILKMLDDA